MSAGYQAASLQHETTLIRKTQLGLPLADLKRTPESTLIPLEVLASLLPIFGPTQGRRNKKLARFWSAMLPSLTRNITVWHLPTTQLQIHLVRKRNPLLLHAVLPPGLTRISHEWPPIPFVSALGDLQGVPGLKLINFLLK